VDLKDGAVRIHASDNVCVAGVKVKILNDEGKVLEQGEAMPLDELWWSFAPQVTLEGRLKVAVEPRDLAGNVTREEKAMENG
jgi:hypothetical protein